jgi:hypothetical protein
MNKATMKIVYEAIDSCIRDNKKNPEVGVQLYLLKADLRIEENKSKEIAKSSPEYALRFGC